MHRSLKERLGDRRITRRDFLKAGGITAATAVGAYLIDRSGVGRRVMRQLGELGERERYSKMLAPGIEYNQVVKKEIPLIYHTVSVDLRSPDIEFLVTPGDDSKGMEVSAQTTRRFLQTHGGDGFALATNGGFFKPVGRRGVLGWYPKDGDPVDMSALAISKGVKYSESKGGHPPLCIGADNDVVITESDCPQGTFNALAGNKMLVYDGEIVVDDGGEAHPRTSVGTVIEDGETVRLWLIAVEGRRNGVSEGVELSELARLMVDELGVDKAINLDGGGSTTLDMIEDGELTQLAVPVHKSNTNIERPVGNHLAIIYNP